jgi:hypothetical protein
MAEFKASHLSFVIFCPRVLQKNVARLLLFVHFSIILLLLHVNILPCDICILEVYNCASFFSGCLICMYYVNMFKVTTVPHNYGHVNKAF